jgi:hypothetical protein
MTYKFLNTIIDDLFAFVIKMPLLHRLSVFRDDLVFLVYIYQRWIYRVDRKRANEFGRAPRAHLRLAGPCMGQRAHIVVLRLWLTQNRWRNATSSACSLGCHFADCLINLSVT